MKLTENERLLAPMFDRAMELRDRGQLDEAIELLEPICADSKWCCWISVTATFRRPDRADAGQLNSREQRGGRVRTAVVIPDFTLGGQTARLG